MPNGNPWGSDPSDTVGDARVFAYIEEFTSAYSFWFLPPNHRHDSRTHLRPWPACGDRHSGLMRLVRYLMAWDGTIERLKAAERGMERQAWVHFLRDDVGGAARDIARQCRYGHRDDVARSSPDTRDAFQDFKPADYGFPARPAARGASFERAVWQHTRKSEQGLGE